MKSNMQAANMRRANRRIQHQENAIRQTEARSFEARIHKRQPIIVSWLGRIKNAIRNLTRRFFRTSAISSLNLLHDMTMSAKQRRGAGAAQLREWFPALGRMVSIRDGKRV